MKNDLFLLRQEEVFYNTRIKYYRDFDGELVPYEVCVADRQIFKDSSAELSEYTKSVDWRLDYEAANDELFGGHQVSSRSRIVTSTTYDKEYYLNASRRRARRKIFDYIINNPFDCFVTLTLNPDQIDRGDYGAVIRKLKDFLGNRVQRKGLIYLGVPELHKNGGLHFHFCVNASAFKLTDSGTVSVSGKKKPIKKATADRLGIPEGDRQTVYNVADWKLGFSTAIMTYGQRGALAHYMRKELDKDCQKRMTADGFIDKIGGRWYYTGGKLLKPVVRLENRSYKEASGSTYQVESEGGNFKFYVLDDSGCVL